MESFVFDLEPSTFCASVHVNGPASPFPSPRASKRNLSSVRRSSVVYMYMGNSFLDYLWHVWKGVPRTSMIVAMCRQALRNLTHRNCYFSAVWDTIRSHQYTGQRVRFQAVARDFELCL